MNDLSNSIFAYYAGNLRRLSEDKQFHFASRLYLWDRQPGMHEVVEKLRLWFTADGNTQEALLQVRRLANKYPDLGSQNALGLRQPYFRQYPEITEYLPILLKVLYLRTVYGIDAHSELELLVPMHDLRSFTERLLADNKAIAVLSTQAINYLYLWAQLSEEHEALIDPKQFLAIGRTGYARDNALQLQLLIYLYTHCIIGASQFYHRPVPDAHRSTYLAMVDEMEQLLHTHFETINLDNKFEFLVSSLVLGRKSPFTARIMDEAEQSISPDGIFLIDRKNNNPQAKNTSFDKSEHRNVLYIMSTTSFQPQGA